MNGAGALEQARARARSGDVALEARELPPGSPLEFLAPYQEMRPTDRAGMSVWVRQQTSHPSRQARRTPRRGSSARTAAAIPASTSACIRSSTGSQG
jgi:hypothetical protein